MRWLVTALAATLLMGVNGRIDVSRRGRLDVMLPASGINPITEQPHVVIGPPISGYHAETLDYIARVEAEGGGLTALEKTAIDALVRSVHSSGFRGDIWRLSVFAGTNLASGLVPLFIGTNQSTPCGYSNDVATAFVEGDFSADGLQGDGTTKYLDTGCKGNTNIGTVAIGAWIADHVIKVTATATHLGQHDAATDKRDTLWSSFAANPDEPTVRLQGSAGGVLTLAFWGNQASNVLVSGYSENTNVYLNWNGTNIGTAAHATNATRVSDYFYVFAESGGPNFISPTQLGGYYIAQGSNTIVQFMVGALSNYAATVGRDWNMDTTFP